jgi:hypothetical protein
MHSPLIFAETDEGVAAINAALPDGKPMTQRR